MTSPEPIYRMSTSSLPDLFTTQEGFAAGLCRRDLAGDDYRQLFRGGYARVGARPPYLQLLKFGLRAVPSAHFVNEHSAGRLYGGITPAASDLHFGTRVRHKSNLRGICLRFYKNDPDLVMHQGVLATTPGQTFLDMARPLEFIDLLVFGDSLVRNAPCSPVYLRQFVADKSAHGAQLAREVAAMVRSNVRSPNKSRLRLLIVSGGLPEPEINHVVTDNRTSKWREIDLAYPEWKVAVEFDGSHHFERRQRDKDILRQEELEALGWKTVVITSTAMYGEPLRVLVRITDKIVAADGPRIRIQDGWQRHFG
ncbi:MAG TPA: DUF559 domain-containing protein [Flexivirga sp.]|uniref:endonuclease domain-containing protein n=1 Tax=Flexivirga sp. TaxID=1962927 RepID=UPI002CB22EC6|nr:DUF559 domain-containing protein [Flexivirga sp.]HWC23448.1 DUF559 domain-containing protein [Flexivirga sp.]